MRSFARWARAAAVLAIVAAVVGTVLQLERSAPAARLEPLPEAAEIAQDAETAITCRRRLPGEETDEEGDRPPEEPDPQELIGRATSTELVNCPDRFDGRRVSFIGEAVGDVLHRDGGAWVQLNDDPYALSDGPIPASQVYAGYNSGVAVWLDGDLAEIITKPGGPRWRGDVLRVEGIFHRADPADGGGLTIRADQAEVLAPPVRLEREVHEAQAIAAGIAAVIALAITAWERRTARRR